LGDLVARIGALGLLDFQVRLVAQEFGENEALVEGAEQGAGLTMTIRQTVHKK
jgi:hypothetical protein